MLNEERQIANAFQNENMQMHKHTHRENATATPDFSLIRKPNGSLMETNSLAPWIIQITTFECHKHWDRELIVEKKRKTKKRIHKALVPVIPNKRHWMADLKVVSVTINWRFDAFWSEYKVTPSIHIWIVHVRILNFVSSRHVQAEWRMIYMIRFHIKS